MDFGLLDRVFLVLMIRLGLVFAGDDLSLILFLFFLFRISMLCCFWFSKKRDVWLYEGLQDSNYLKRMDLCRGGVVCDFSFFLLPCVMIYDRQTKQM